MHAEDKKMAGNLAMTVGVLVFITIALIVIANILM